MGWREVRQPGVAVRPEAVRTAGQGPWVVLRGAGAVAPEAPVARALELSAVPGGALLEAPAGPRGRRAALVLRALAMPPLRAFRRPVRPPTRAPQWT